MNDSFLEDLDLIPKDTNAPKNPQLNNRYITTRSIPSNVRTKNEFDNPEVKQEKIISSSSVPKTKTTRRSGSQDPSKLTVTEKKPLSSTPKSERKSQGEENLIKPVENQIKMDNLKVKPHDVKAVTKLQENKSVKDRRRSGSSTGSSRFLDVSGKENTRPLTDSSSSRESGSQAELKKDFSRRASDGVSRKSSDILEKTDPVMFLNAIKDLVSRYTEQETVKVLRAMQNLHINSQANLIKHLMLQTSELVRELDLHKNSGNVKSLIEENERMREDIFILRARNEVLQKKVDEMALIKEENISLKLKLKELQQ
ncbi:uncharacterized protein LOC100679491 [Nasonia vitripennis]|uniref:Uncharacterized protein n=1 Tax=Nasonia vitripennis TaxID=7425 RepID=A0A7M7LTR3_NASVI|nr:uncharacterized protein LOC100679491 [Nasonia vitripennis]